MARNSHRRQVTGKTTKGDSISIPRVSSNGNATENARAKGCFGGSGKTAVKIAKGKKKQK
jgi:hypothetical protein